MFAYISKDLYYLIVNKNMEKISNNTLGGTRHIIGTIIALILIPLYTQQKKLVFKGGKIAISITSALTLVSIIDLLFITIEEASKSPVPILMLIFQILASLFSYRAMKQTMR